MQLMAVSGASPARTIFHVPVSSLRAALLRLPVSGASPQSIVTGASARQRFAYMALSLFAWRCIPAAIVRAGSPRSQPRPLFMKVVY